MACMGDHIESLFIIINILQPKFTIYDLIWPLNGQKYQKSW